MPLSPVPPAAARIPDRSANLQQLTGRIVGGLMLDLAAMQERGDLLEQALAAERQTVQRLQAEIDTLRSAERMRVPVAE